VKDSRLLKNGRSSHLLNSLKWWSKRCSMNENDVIKAIECCCENENCRECPLAEMHSAICIKKLMNNTLDLIKRQQAEIYNLKEDLSEYRNVPILTKNDCLIATVEKRADGKQYHTALLTIKMDEIRAEAYKEFAEEFEKRCIASGIYPAITQNILKNLVKEKTEGSNGE
jgi:hypothetical protein